MSFNFDFELEELKTAIRNNNITEERVKLTLKKYRDLSFEIQKLLDYAVKITKGNEREKIYKIYKNLLNINAGEMAEKLRNLGYSLKNDPNYENVKEALSDQAFRILERTRHAQRSEVFYIIERIFIANNRNFPPLLVQVFNPNYSEEIFKTFIYSFLSGILGEKEEGGLE
ncbi:MAG: hypothetical protein NZ845_05445 [Thermodesulfovibrio sp.]|nr:hypothetical protein [Thermodesulfovibrio sp.]